MAQTDWANRPNTADMRDQYRAVADLARRGGFRAPESGWPAELVLAHLVATNENFLAVGAGVQRGERLDCGHPELVEDEALTRRVAEAGGLAGLAGQLEATADRLAAHADSLTDAEAETQVRFTVYHEGRQLMDEPRAWGNILAGQTTFHLPMHLRQLEALTE
jgi:hypothetical protein